MKVLGNIAKGLRIVVGRLREHGLITTLVWVYGRGMPKLTGVPIMRFSQITPQLYVGGQHNAEGKAALEKEGIRSSVNMRIEYDDAAHGLDLENYCYLPTIDDDAISPEHLREGVAFITAQIDAGEKVYIHCAGGIGRAPTMAAAYLVQQGYTVDEAYAFIAEKRPFIRPTPVQVRALRRFAREFKDSV